MNDAELNDSLYEKMVAEQDKYRDWLKSLPPTEILNHAYEYSVREDIICWMDGNDLNSEQAAAMLASPTPLADFYCAFCKVDSTHMEELGSSIEDRAEQQLEELNRAKQLIVDFCRDEYGSMPDFSNLARVAIAYTTLEDEDIPLQVNVDLINCRIERYLGEDFLNEVKYHTLAELIRNELEDLDFDTLVAVSEGQREKARARLEQSPEVQQGQPEHAEDPLAELLACNAQTELKKMPVYPHSVDYAREHGELEQYRASKRLNVQCKLAIEAAVREHFDGIHLSHDAAKGVIDAYGIDRVALVLASTVRFQDWDDRYSRQTKEWAENVPDHNTETARRGYALNSHPTVLNEFIGLVREELVKTQSRHPKRAEDPFAELQANLACNAAIEAAVARNYSGSRLDRKAVTEVVEQFGTELTLRVLANAIQQRPWEGRFSPDNKMWAQQHPVLPILDSAGCDHRRDFVLEDIHPGLIDVFLTQLRWEVEKAKERPSVLIQLKQNMGKEPTAEKAAHPHKKDPER